MTLVLKGTALNEEPMSLPLIGRFDERGGTLGRSETSTFTLPDPERTISRIQAQVLHRDDGYFIENVSAASPILHNGRALSAGMRVLLRDGDELRIGGYTLLAAFEDNENSATILRGRTVIMQPDDTPVPKTAPAHVAFNVAPPPEAALKVAPALMETPAARAEAPAPPHDAQVPPRDAQAPHRPAGVQSAMSAESLWRGFLEGAGIELSPSHAPSPELLRAVGAMLRIAVGGIHRLVAMRTVAKGEMQAEMTMTRVRDNNPLKFAPDAEVALRLLLQPPARGFMDGLAAMRAALIDLQSHRVGMMAGMRSALEGVLGRFDPAKLDTQLTTGSVLDSLLPAHRRARLWALYIEHYASVREEAQEDFQRLFGEAFREAYEEQIRSLDAAHDAAAPSGPRAGGRAR